MRTSAVSGRVPYRRANPSGLGTADEAGIEMLQGLIASGTHGRTVGQVVLHMGCERQGGAADDDVAAAELAQLEDSLAQRVVGGGAVALGPEEMRQAVGAASALRAPARRA